MVSNLDRIENAGGIRSMAARWVVTGDMRLETAAHFGGESEGFADMIVLRDPLDGVTPLLPGTSLAGALRSHLADVFGGYYSAEYPDIAQLFGASRKNDDEGAQSPLIVFDSLGRIPANLQVEIRDGVAIDPKTGTAEKNKKFDMEVLPAGTVFPVRFELIIGNSTQEQEMVGFLSEVLEGLDNGDIALGIRRSRGLGSVKVQGWKAMRFDLNSQAGWMQWLATDHEHPFDGEVPAFTNPRAAIITAYPELNILEISDARNRVLVDLCLQIIGGLLVRSPGSEPTAPDVVHLHSAGNPVLPGTSLAGAMRSQALRIARCVRDSQGDGDEWINRLFGPCFEKKQSSSLASPTASRLRVSENFISDSNACRQTRIAIDRFTGGVVQGALFDEEVCKEGVLKVRIELRDPDDAEIGLLLLILKDLLTGEIPVGGSVSVGRGALKGTATVLLEDGKKYEIGPDLQVQEDVMNVFNSYIKRFREYPLNTEEVPV
jgi:CRISPR/Cas system CSM-associated protein Csm3 (group 7 of RAMP superfamily)